MPHMLSETDINDRTDKLTNAIGNQVKLRRDALNTQLTSVTNALADECNRVKTLAAAQADAQFKQQTQALEMRKDQEMNHLDTLAQQQMYQLSQHAAAMQQERAKMELAE